MHALLMLAQAAPPVSDGHALLGSLYTGLVSLVGVALTAAMAFLTNLLAQKAKASKVAAFAFTVWEKAQSVVAYVDVHIRPTVDKDLADGALTAEEKAELKAEAMKLLKEALGEAGLTKLSSLLGLFGGAADVFLSGLIERALGVQRSAVAPSP